MEKLENSVNATLFVRPNANPFVSLPSPSNAEPRLSQYQHPLGDCQFFATARVEIELRCLPSRMTRSHTCPAPAPYPVPA